MLIVETPRRKCDQFQSMREKAVLQKSGNKLLLSTFLK
jgi:hypothetical protein